MEFILFFLGTAAGSFLGVIADRYREDLPIWDKKIIGGRSFCEFCKTKLRWFELVPIFSFLFQRGKCLTCGRRLSIRYPLFEIGSGLIFLLIPLGLKNIYGVYTVPYLASSLWIAVFWLLFLASVIDLKLRIIPDEIEILLLALGTFVIVSQPFGATEGSFLGGYGILFGIRDNVWLNHFFAAAAAALLFAFLILITKGKGMGGGDMKLAAAMGFVFGWPDIILVVILSFVVGSFFGIAAIFLRKAGFRSSVAFGPFLSLAGIIVFFFGYGILKFYFGLFGL